MCLLVTDLGFTMILLMLAVPVTIYSRVPMNVEIVVLNCQKCNQCTAVFQRPYISCIAHWGCSLNLVELNSETIWFWWRRSLSQILSLGLVLVVNVPQSRCISSFNNLNLISVATRSLSQILKYFVFVWCYLNWIPWHLNLRIWFRRRRREACLRFWVLVWSRWSMFLNLGVFHRWTIWIWSRRRWLKACLRFWVSVCQLSVTAALPSHCQHLHLSTFVNICQHLSTLSNLH